MLIPLGVPSLRMLTVRDYTEYRLDMTMADVVSRQW